MAAASCPPPSPARPSAPPPPGPPGPFPTCRHRGGGVGITLIAVNPERLRSEEGAEGIWRKNPQLVPPLCPPHRAVWS